MDTFLMICYVAADFCGRNGEKFRVTPDKIGVFVEAPAWIRETLLFKMLVKDGSIRIGVTTEDKKKLENDPMEGVTAEGKEAPEKDEHVIKTRKKATTKKKDDA